MKTSIRSWAARFNRVNSRRWKQRAKHLSACLAVGLATAWASPAEATVVHLEVTPDQPLGPAFVVYYHNNSSSGFLQFLGNLPAGETSRFDYDFNEPIEAFQGSYPGFVILAVHNEGAGDSEGVTTSFASDWPIVDGETFQTIFTDHDGPTRQRVIDGLKDLNFFSPVAFTNRFKSIIEIPFGSVATLINFSDPTLGGTAIATVPEPATWVLLVTGSGLLLARARRPRR
jgi:hypothetical protein